MSFIEWMMEEIGDLVNRIGNAACGVLVILFLSAVGLAFFAIFGPPIYEYVQNNPLNLALPYVTETP